MSTLMKKRALSAPFKFGQTYKRRNTGKRTYIKGFYRRSGYYGRYPPLGNEYKFFDTTWDESGIAATGLIALDSVNEVAAGTGENQRIGRKITIRSIHVRWDVVLTAGTTANETDDNLRLIVYLDRQCNGATAAVTDILETAAYKSFNNLSNKNRFKILADKFTDINSMSGAYTGSTDNYGKAGKYRSMHMKCNIPVEFSSTTGAITEIRSNNVGVLLITANANANSEGQVRIRYTDS